MLNIEKPNNSNTTTLQLPILSNLQLRPILGNVCFDNTTKDLYVSDGTTTYTFLNSLGNGITSINGLTAAVQTLSLGTTGTDLNWVDAVSDHTLNVPDASATARGVITTGVQTIAGNKTLTGNTQLNNVLNSVIDSNTNTVRASSLGTTTNPVVVNTSIPPTIGQILTATSPTTATWQNGFTSVTVTLTLTGPWVSNYPINVICEKMGTWVTLRWPTFYNLGAPLAAVISTASGAIPVGYRPTVGAFSKWTSVIVDSIITGVSGVVKVGTDGTMTWSTGSTTISPPFVVFEQPYPSDVTYQGFFLDSFTYSIS